MEKLRVVGLMTLLTVILVGLGGYIGGNGGAMMFFIIALAMNFGMYWFSDRMVLKMYKAKIIDRDTAPELYDMVDRLRQRAGLPMPTVAIAPTTPPRVPCTMRPPV